MTALDRLTATKGSRFKSLNAWWRVDNYGSSRITLRVVDSNDFTPMQYRPDRRCIFCSHQMPHTVLVHKHAIYGE